MFLILTNLLFVENFLFVAFSLTKAESRSRYTIVKNKHHCPLTTLKELLKNFQEQIEPNLFT